METMRTVGTAFLGHTIAVWWTPQLPYNTNTLLRTITLIRHYAIATLLEYYTIARLQY